ncbi:MAG: hypothetical protein JOZ49_09000 [Mycolicibacterium sp.]|nr:hypothetical protein [Mycolicibacterium sp.]
MAQVAKTAGVDRLDRCPPAAYGWTISVPCERSVAAIAAGSLLKSAGSVLMSGALKRRGEVEHVSGRPIA